MSIVNHFGKYRQMTIIADGRSIYVKGHKQTHNTHNTTKWVLLRIM